MEIINWVIENYENILIFIGIFAVGSIITVGANIIKGR